MLLALTLTTGIVDAVSYLGLGRVFTANMTGNVVLLGFALARVPDFSIGSVLLAIGAFLAGAAAGGRLALGQLAATRRRWLGQAIVIEILLFVAAALVAVGMPAAGTRLQTFGVIALTTIAMGFRNATVRALAIPDLTTTVLTMTLTGIAADSSLAGGKNTRLSRRVASVMALLLGGLVGAWLVRTSITVPLLVVVAILVLATLAFILNPASVLPAVKSNV